MHKMIFGLGGGIVGLIALVCAVLVIYDVWSNQKKMKDTNKILWTIAALILNILTAIVYYFVVKRK